MVLVVKNMPANAGDMGWGDPLEEGIATHPTIPAWRISWIKDLGGLQSIGSQRVRHN